MWVLIKELAASLAREMVVAGGYVRIYETKMAQPNMKLEIKFGQTKHMVGCL